MFINDDEAKVAAEAWVAEHEGWEYKGQHLVKGEDAVKKHSEYEVHKIQAPEVGKARLSCSCGNCAARMRSDTSRAEAAIKNPHLDK